MPQLYALSIHEGSFTFTPVPVEVPLPEPPEPFWVAWPIQSHEAPRITDGGKFNAPRNYANGKHEGADGDAFDNTTGTNAIVVAAQDGVVEYVCQRGDSPSYGLHVVLKHPWGAEADRWRTLYAHLSQIFVVPGAIVKRGTPLGVAGRTGTEAIHLHWSVHDAVAGLKGYVRCKDCSAFWPDGVIDPESVLRKA
jgi:murein DD-endopeptidase MepM/ murein hydrolase activator NlpD